MRLNAMNNLLIKLLILLALAPHTIYAQSVALVCEDGVRIYLTEEEIGLSRKIAGAVEQHRLQSASDGALEFPISGIVGGVLGSLVSAMRQLQQARHGYAWRRHIRSYDLMSRIILPDPGYSLQALKAADFLQVDPILIQALARQLAYKMEREHRQKQPWKRYRGETLYAGDMYKYAWSEKTKQQLAMLPAAVVDEVYRQHLIRFAPVASRLDIYTQVKISLEDVYAWSTKPVVNTSGQVLEAIGRYITELGDMQRLARILPNLTTLDVSNNYLRELPANLKAFSNLAQLDIAGNPIVGDSTLIRIGKGAEYVEARKRIRAAFPDIRIFFESGDWYDYQKAQEPQDTGYTSYSTSGNSSSTSTTPAFPYPIYSVMAGLIGGRR